MKTNEEWIDYIKRLSKDNILRKQIGEKGMRQWKASFPVNANKGTYLSIIDQVIAS